MEMFGQIQLPTHQDQHIPEFWSQAHTLSNGQIVFLTLLPHIQAG